MNNATTKAAETAANTTVQTHKTVMEPLCAAHTGFDVSTVGKALKRLIAKGYVACTKMAYGATSYVLNMVKISTEPLAIPEEA